MDPLSSSRKNKIDVLNFVGSDFRNHLKNKFSGSPCFCESNASERLKIQKKSKQKSQNGSKREKNRCFSKVLEKIRFRGGIKKM
jgi:hypothetical protein